MNALGKIISPKFLKMKRYLPLCLALVLLVTANTAAKKAQYKITRKNLEQLSSAMQEVLAGLSYLLNPYQIRHFLSLESDSARSEWLSVFWKAHDPTPATPENQMRTEHVIRARLARQFFGLDEWPGWDKRGEIFIRYGPPSFRGKVWGEVTSRKMYPPKELWYYKRLNMLVSFENFGLHGEYIYSVDPLGAAENLSPELIEFLLYETDQSLSSRIPLDLLERDYSSILDEENRVDRSPRLPENIDAIMDPDRGDITPQESSLIFHKDRIREAVNNFEEVLESTPSSYPFNFTNKPLPFFFDVDQFKAGSGLNRVEVHIEMPMGAAGGSGTREYQASAVVWDTQFNEIAREDRSILVELEPGAEKRTRLLPTQLVFSLRRGYYRLGITVEEKTTNCSSSYRTAVAIEDFDGALAVSSIIFARRISQADKPSIFTRGPLEIVPHPVHAYRKAFAIPIYFEIYNLRLDEKGSTSYTVEYRIIPRSTRKEHFWEKYEKAIPIVSSRFSGSGYTRDDPYHIFIRTDNFREGSFELLITVKDEHAQTVAYRKAAFSIVK